MRSGTLLPLFALLCGCATEAAVTGSVPETAASLAALPAAAPATEDVTPPAVAPVALSRTQVMAMEDALWRALEDPAWVKLGPYSVGLGRDGAKVVCGTYRMRNSFGVYSKTTPFRGEFRGNEFKPAALAIASAGAAATLAACEKAGLPINLAAAERG